MLGRAAPKGDGPPCTEMLQWDARRHRSLGMERTNESRDDAATWEMISAR